MYISYVGLLDRACDNMHNINIMNNNPKISMDFVHVPVLVLLCGGICSKPSFESVKRNKLQKKTNDSVGKLLLPDKA